MGLIDDFNERRRRAFKRPETSSEKFALTLPGGPLVRHLQGIHEIAVYLADAPIDEGGNALLVLEHHLREIATMTKADPYKMRPLRGDGIRRERD